MRTGEKFWRRRSSGWAVRCTLTHIESRGLYRDLCPHISRPRAVEHRVLGTALFMLPGLAMTLAVSEPVAACGLPKTLREAVIEPFREFLGRKGWRHAI